LREATYSKCAKDDRIVAKTEIGAGSGNSERMRADPPFI
jgi:hypothetical protein